MDSYSKRLEKARKAFQHGDENASALAHDPALIAKAAEEHGGAGSQYLGEMVYGGLDGIITTFAVVSGVAGAQLGGGGGAGWHIEQIFYTPPAWARACVCFPGVSLRSTRG